ncbi:MAG: hypothetical protein B7Y41_05650 [Hydrogenophilales bacterium 28-61-23]|nr:MAG: hypothetical protein B7Y41_05650 [Hydrogenophilales bacterium 28-61-23]
MRFSRALPLLTLVASFSATAYATEIAQPAANMAQLLQAMQERLARLEARNAELERHLAEPAPERQELADRVDDVENQVRILKQPRKLERALDGISASAAMTMVAQHAMGGTSTGKHESQLNYRVDVELEIPGDRLGKLIGVGDSKFFAHFRAGQGNGLGNLNSTLTGTTNSSTFQLSDGDDSAAILAQAWYQLGIPVSPRSGVLGRFEATVGKIDMFGFFDGNDLADDESEGFLNNVFVHNPLLDSGGDIGADSYGFAPGARLAYIDDINSSRHWTFSLGWFGSSAGASFNGNFSKPFAIAQAEYTGKVLAGRSGNYRLYTWSNGAATAYSNEFDSTQERHAGWGLSLDQQVTRNLALFSRYGQSSQGQVKFDRAFTFGGQLGGFGWARARDRVGLAFGWLRPSAAFKAIAPTLDANADTSPDFGFAPTGAEKQVELFYAWQVNDNLQLTPSLQWIVQPGGDGALKDIAVIGLRAKAAF